MDVMSFYETLKQRYARAFKSERKIHFSLKVNMFNVPWCSTTFQLMPPLYPSVPFCSGKWRSPHRPGLSWASRPGPCPPHRCARSRRSPACTRSGTWAQRSGPGSCSGRSCCSRGSRPDRGYEARTPAAGEHNISQSAGEC